MFFDDKKAITTMIGKRNGKGERTMSPTEMNVEVSKDEDGEMNGLHAAAEDILGAFSEKSPQRLMEALSNFLSIHSSQAAESSEEAME